ncbi:MAG: ABC transporter permease [Chthonomonadales bacterium]|nr:ABC transporter permease [Chthonomonadales bacterium]
MTLARLVLRSLWHYRATALATAAGVAVAACVISGSLVAGNSVAATVRRTALARLGSTDVAIISSRPFGAHVAEAMSQVQGAVITAPLLLRPASAANPDTDVTAAGVQVIGADQRFLRLFARSARLPRFEGRAALVSEALAQDLALQPGDTLILHVASQTTEPTASVFARRKLSEAIRPLRLECAAVAPADGPGGFALYAETAQPRNVIVDRAWLAEQIGADSSADVVLIHVRPGADLSGIERALRSSVRLGDLGLTVAAHETPILQVVVRGSSVTLSDSQLEALARLDPGAAGRVDPASIMLASRIACQRTGAAEHYVLSASVPDIAVPDDGIVLNRWIADDLQARIGDAITIEWLEPAPDGSYPSRTAVLRVHGIVPIAAARDQMWAVPEFKGITDTARISDWDPPFPLDLSRITSRDETYWERYRTAPKAFISQAMARRMWGDGSSGWASAVRFRVGPTRSLSDARDDVEKAIMASEHIRRDGPTLRHVRAEALRAAEGSSDFRGLMLGMSIFIVASGIALASMMLRLSTERRASQIGIMLATGLSPKVAAVSVAAEGALAALAGSVVGSALGIPFAGALVTALNSWWAGAVARHRIELVPDAVGLASGAMGAFALGSLAAWLTARRMASAPALRLLGGWRATAMAGHLGSGDGALHPSAALESRPARRSPLIWWAMTAVGAALVVWRGVGRIPEAAAALSGGAVLLAAGLGLLSAYLTSVLDRRQPASALSLRRIAARNAALRRGQSVLIAGMIAGSAFLLVVVAANVRSGSSFNVRDRSSGAGGFNLIARTSGPLAIGFDTPTGRANLGFDPQDEAAFDGVEIVPFLISPGVDASCLNLAKPVAPRILGVSDAFVRRGGFSVRTLARTDRPWSLLAGDRRAGSGAATTIPAFGDAESVRWILQSGLGKTIVRETATGSYRLRFDGLVAFSIFAGDILVSERDFHRMFPDVRAPSYFLIRTPERSERAVADALRRNLGDAGMEVRSTRELLIEVLAVQNTYLSAFLLLGGLGIALGSLGLGVVQLRSAYERGSELAIMTAVGLTRRDLAAMILMESSGLLLYGAALGAVTAAAANAARIASGEAAVNWAALGAVLIGTVGVGLASCVMAAYRATSGRIVDAIRAE